MMSGRDERGAVASARYGRSGVGALCLRLRPIEGRSDTPLLSAPRERVWPPVGCVTTSSGVRYSVVNSELRVGFGEIWRNRSGTRQGFGLDGETEAVHSDEPFSARKEHWLELEMEWLTDSN